MTAVTLEQLLGTLLEEESLLNDLLALALEEQEALVRSDFAAMESVSGRMLEVAGRLETLEGRRDALMDTIGQPGCRLEDLLPLAETHGVPGFPEAHLRLAAVARDLREVQECNAHLIVGAMRLRERWLALLAGVASSTYGEDGRQELTQGRGFVSRSA